MSRWLEHWLDKIFPEMLTHGTDITDTGLLIDRT